MIQENYKGERNKGPQLSCVSEFYVFLNDIYGIHENETGRPGSFIIRRQKFSLEKRVSCCGF